MIKKLLLIIFTICFMFQIALAQDLFRVTSVNFDTSNSLIFITSPDNTTEAILKDIKLTNLQNPKRVYFDINSAILTTKKQNWYLYSGGIKQVNVAPVSSSKVRVTLYLNENFNQGKIKFLKVNNNLVINYKGGLSSLCSNEYFQKTFRDERASSSDFYEKLSISNEDLIKIKNAANNIAKENDNKLTQIQNAFGVSENNFIETKDEQYINKELKLKSRYYLNAITLQKDGFLVSGFGGVGFEKTMYLTNPKRAVFDIPNAIINPNIKDKEIKIGADTVKIGQFSTNKARICITSQTPEKYFTIFSSDGQAVLFANTPNVDTNSLFSKTNDAVSYFMRRIPNQKLPTDEFIIAFNGPVIHSLKRENNLLTMNFYNTLRYNDKNFRDTIRNTDLYNMNIDLLPNIGLKLTLPLEKNVMTTCYLGADGKSVRIVLKGVTPKIDIPQPVAPQEKLVRLTNADKQSSIPIPNIKGKKTIVIDAGHGGSDYGAMRSGINEKDINLDVAKRVQTILSSRGISVALTRSTDDFISLADRTVITNKYSPEAFVSIHVNASRSEASGIETHYYHQHSLELAQAVHSELASAILTPDRGLVRSKFYVINHTQVPAVLVEIGFISNDEERAQLTSEARKNKTAKAIADGIIKYLKKN